MATIKYKDGAEWKYLPLGGPSVVPMDTWHTVNDGATGLGTTYGSGVVSTGAQPLQFRKSLDGKVLCRGACSCPTAAGSILFRLPVGYRPPADFVRFHGSNAADTTVAMYYVTALGDVTKATTGTSADISCVEFDTDTVTMFPMAGVGLPPRVTALPSSPSDGQEVYYVASAADGVLWHLKYNLASASAYKWELVGGSALVSESIPESIVSMVGTTWGTFDANDPRVVVPLAGDYDVRHTASGFAQTTATPLGIAVGSVVPPDHTTAAFQYSASTSWASITQMRRVTLAVGNTLRQYYYQGAATQNLGWRSRSLRAVPVRVG